MNSEWTLAYREVSPLAQTYQGNWARGPLDFLIVQEMTVEELVTDFKEVIEQRFVILDVGLWIPAERTSSKRWYTEIVLAPLYAGDIQYQLFCLYNELKDEGLLYEAAKTWPWDVPGEVAGGIGSIMELVVLMVVMMIMKSVMKPMMAALQIEEKKNG